VRTTSSPHRAWQSLPAESDTLVSTVNDAKSILLRMERAQDILSLGFEAEARLTPDQGAFLRAAREWLKRVSLADVEASASHEPRHTTWGTFRDPGVVWIVLRPTPPPARRFKDRGSVQLGISSKGFIFGGWQGYPYVWEFDKNEAFRFAVHRFGLEEAEAAAFAWAERELRQQRSS
jgi:hypothetical protein